ncbi:MAG: hypothetical protein A2898_02275 [Candidatus Kerfeldbacteria bacterium RIFCSPLOWO2_01_FULL_48_11]|uniref:2'-5' RNA ligase n=1 Tax=Candidatus Kerfeldbacteria bacterium RIFCSPLOWO2_01_FULL_48_11 TaxID=1798543 RepID=A0A1G2B2A3_9BACT|nr:MAG: hypothetical protein UY34_C0015G0019 [Parcubacteria group bacterium GW2011_GWA2_48_9]KKW16386.1 MAG: hypothetical protein UY52_C0005G0021 [Parcubacteria group bacterium GW2011_GWC2_49_9]OGY83085.1 MAG: hypothetical protein A2898_02275 [Candidatus Kerfeldbacteria bacterium RIFCSPLOWO2_01_FULL_48_11]HCM68121.1 hypothetical protein [Candidatus Kerfeldbacteria bacterium]
MPGEILAVDVAILLEGELRELAIQLNREIRNSNPNSYELGDDKKPHITLGMGFVTEHDVDRFVNALNASLKDQTSVDARFLGIEILDGGRHSDMKLEKTEELVSLHKRIMEVLAPFETTYLGDAAGYVLDEGETPSERSIHYQQEYRKLRSFEHYRPHVTIGKGSPITKDVPPQIYTQHRIGLCQMGAHGNCRRIIHGWRLP